MPLLEVMDLAKSYEMPAVEKVSLRLEQGRILCLLGPSGCGKTTLLRLIAGLEPPDGGRVMFSGRDLSSIPPHRRQFGMMFQDFALFPHKNVFDNVAFGLQMLHLDKGEIIRRTEDVLTLTGLSAFRHRNIDDLSGGERQRVALARSLAPQPKLLMLDEPMGSLDRALRERLLLDIRAILKRLDMTAIFVTHDQSEAFSVADDIAVMNRGSIVQTSTPEQLYLHPKNTFVAQFLGFKNLLQGSVTGDGGVQTALGIFYPPSGRYQPGALVTLLLRPETARLAVESGNVGGTDFIRGRVKSRVFTGQHFRVGLVSDDAVELTFDLPNHDSPPMINEPILLQLNPETMMVI